MTEVTLAPEDAAPQGKGKLIFWGLGALLIVAAGIAVYFLVIKKQGSAAPAPTDSQGKLADWKSRDGYVGNVDPVEASNCAAGQLCKMPGSSPASGTCQLLTTSGSPPGFKSGASAAPTSAYGCVSIVPGQPGWAKNGQDCAASCYANGDFWALYNGATNACLCRPRTDKTSYWDRCVLPGDSKGWEVWSSPEHQKDCDVSGINAYQGVWKGIGDSIVPPIAKIPTTLEGCKTEIKGRIGGGDTRSYGVFDGRSGFCYVKTDDPGTNPFWECKNSDSSLPLFLVTDNQDLDSITGLPDCPQVAMIKVKGDKALPQKYLRAQTVKAQGATSCLNACAVFDTNGNDPTTMGPKPAATWNGSDCTCYDFPSNAANLEWACQYNSDPTAENTLPLYVRTGADDPLGVSNVPETLKDCKHDPAKVPDPVKDPACDPQGLFVHDCAKSIQSDCQYSMETCNRCRYLHGEGSYIPMWGNALDCSGSSGSNAKGPGSCISNVSPLMCNGRARCGGAPMLGGPCVVGTGGQYCPKNTTCYSIQGRPGHNNDDADDECGACQYKDKGKAGAGESCTSGGIGSHNNCISGICVNEPEAGNVCLGA